MHNVDNTISTFSDYPELQSFWNRISADAPVVEGWRIEGMQETAAIIQCGDGYMYAYRSPSVGWCSGKQSLEDCYKEHHKWQHTLSERWTKFFKWYFKGVDEEERRIVCTNDCYYVILPECTDKWMSGFYGDVFEITFMNGDVIETSNLWHCARIPPAFALILKPNATIKRLRSQPPKFHP